ncbi:MAG: hypothetical protein AB1Z57_09695 [Acidimicrobiia bacterium]
MSGLHVLTAAYPEVTTTDRALLTRPSAVPEHAFVLSTCLRHDVVFAGGDDEVAAVVDRVTGGTPIRGVRLLSDLDAAQYVFRVAAGLESPIVGEREIWTQFRKALADTKATGAVPGLLVRLLDQAVATGRLARDLLPARPHDSMGAVAAQMVGHLDHVAVFGSGEMARAVVDSLQMLPSPPTIVVAARRPETVAMEGVETVSFDTARRLLADHPAVISATSAKTRLVPADEVRVILAGRPDDLVLVDMAMPPDFDPGDAPHVTYVDIDDLARMASRRPRPTSADDAVRDAADDAYRRYRSHHDAAPVITDLVARADRIVDDVVARFGNRSGDEAVLRQAVHTAARRLIADPLAFANAADADERSVLAEAFRLDG